jgi:hypothetical protein
MPSADINDERRASRDLEHFAESWNLLTSLLDAEPPERA